MNAPRILSVQPLENTRLRVMFVNGADRFYDCPPLLSREVFQLLRNEVFFKAVKVDAGGYGISWSDEADLSEYALWTNGVDMPPFLPLSALDTLNCAGRGSVYSLLPMTSARRRGILVWLHRGFLQSCFLLYSAFKYPRNLDYNQNG